MFLHANMIYGLIFCVSFYGITSLDSSSALISYGLNKLIRQINQDLNRKIRK